MLAFASVALACSAASALPPAGSRLPDARVVDADGHGLALAALPPRPALMLYEDKDSATHNQALKDELARLARGDQYRNVVELIAVADVSAYDFWPVKGFVKDAIRDASRKAGTVIWCDWDGSFRRALALQRGASNVILVGRDGAVLFARAGALSAADRTQLLDLLRSQT